MDEFARAAHAKEAAVRWYEERARLIDGEALRMRWIGFIVQAAILRNHAKLLRRAAAAEQIPQVLFDEGG